MLYLKAVLFTVFVPGTVAGLVPYLIIRGDAGTPPWWTSWPLLGWVPIAAGGAILLWCIGDFALAGKGTPAPIDPPKRLVIHGLYRYVRNPMYVGVLSILMGELLLSPSPALLIYVAVVHSMFHAFVVFYEEPNLRKKFGASYDAYCREANRWLPWWPRRDDGFPRSRE